MDKTTIQTLCDINTRFYQSNAPSFSATRNAPWLGWKKCARLFEEKVFAGANPNVSVLDLACGNLRFEEFLSEQFPHVAFSFYAIDNCNELLPSEKVSAQSEESSTATALTGSPESTELSEALLGGSPTVTASTGSVESTGLVELAQPKESAQPEKVAQHGAQNKPAGLLTKDCFASNKIVFQNQDIIVSLLDEEHESASQAGETHTQANTTAFQTSKTRTQADLTASQAGETNAQANQNPASQNCGTFFDIAVSFGFMHHIPTQQLRLKALQKLIDAVRPGGLIAVSFWEFLNNEKLAEKAELTHQQALAFFSQQEVKKLESLGDASESQQKAKSLESLEDASESQQAVKNLESSNNNSENQQTAKFRQEEALARHTCLDITQLEKGDYFLGWKDTTHSFRYCHNFTEEEIDELANAVKSKATPIAHFLADGRSDNLNSYLVLQKR